jgi:hypothetical protein
MCVLCRESWGITVKKKEKNEKKIVKIMLANINDETCEKAIQIIFEKEHGHVIIYLVKSFWTILERLPDR